MAIGKTLPPLRERRFATALDPAPEQARLLVSHRGAARKAFNEALAQVPRCLDQRDAERSYAVPDEQLTQVPVDLVGAARLVEPEQAADRAVVGGEFQGGVQLGLDALARGLRQWSASRSGKRRGPKTGFSRFKSRRHARVSCTFTIGVIRVDDATHVVLPRIGRVHTLKPASALLGRIGAGTARVRAATVSFGGRRWYCSSTVETGREPARPAHVGADRAHPVMGVDDQLQLALPEVTWRQIRPQVTLHPAADLRNWCKATRRASPIPATIDTFRAPLRRGVPHGCASKLFAAWPSPRFRRARHSLVDPQPGG